MFKVNDKDTKTTPTDCLFQVVFDGFGLFQLAPHFSRCSINSSMAFFLAEHLMCPATLKILKVKALQKTIKSQNFKNHDFTPFEKNCSFLPNLASFYRIFLETLAYQLKYIYNQFVCYLEFQKLKKDFENLFSSCHKVN